MNSIETLQSKIEETNAAIAALGEAVATEKQEVTEKLTELEAKITEQSELIEDLRLSLSKGEIPEGILDQLTAGIANIQAFTLEVKNIVSTPSPVIISPEVEEVE